MILNFFPTYKLEWPVNQKFLVMESATENIDICFIIFGDWNYRYALRHALLHFNYEHQDHF